MNTVVMEHLNGILLHKSKDLVKSSIPINRPVYRLPVEIKKYREIGIPKLLTENAQIIVSNLSLESLDLYVVPIRHEPAVFWGFSGKQESHQFMAKLSVLELLLIYIFPNSSRC